MTSTPLDNPTIPPPKKSVLPALLRSPSESDLQNILADFVPAHAHYDEIAFMRLLQSWLKKYGLALSYRLKDSALRARQQARDRMRR